MLDRKRAAILAIVIQAFLANLLVLDFFPDDAFISFRYAKNLSQDQTLYYNIDEAGPHGFTNPLWVLLLALLHSLSGRLIPIEFIARLLCTISLGFVTCLALLALPPIELKSSARAIAWAVAAAALLLFFPYLLPNFFSGLETALFSCTLTILLLRLFRGGTFTLVDRVALAIAFSIRIDALVLCSPLLILMTIRGSDQDGFAATLRQIVPVVAFTLFIHATVMLFTDTVFPLSFGHKSQHFSGRLFLHYLKISNVLLLPVCLLLWRAVNRCRFVFIVSYMSFVCLFYSFFIHWHFERYIFPFVFAIFISSLGASAKILLRVPARVLLVLGLYVSLTFIPGTFQGYTWVSGYRVAMIHLVKIAGSLARSKVPEHERLIAMPDAGIVPFISDWRLLDTRGLTTPEVIHHDVGDLLRKKKPAIVIIDNWAGIPRSKLKLTTKYQAPVTLPEEYRLVHFMPLVNRYWWSDLQYNYYIFAAERVDDTLINEIQSIHVDVESEMSIQKPIFQVLRSLAELFH